jgi:transmembrane sensor
MAVIMSLLRVTETDQPTNITQEIADTSQMVHETMLSDGSKVELAPRSSIEVSYTDKVRELSLSSGEGYFSVAPNKERPFVVKVGSLNVRAVGTEFNVRRAEGRVVVTVTKGTVDVYPGAAQQISADITRPGPGGVRVSEGNEVTWATDTKAPMVAAIDTKHAATWRQGRLEYIQEPLSSVIADVNRYSTRQIVIGDKEVGQMSFTGTVLTDETGEWLRSLPSVFPVKIASDRQRDTLELRSREAPRSTQ